MSEYGNFCLFLVFMYNAYELARLFPFYNFWDLSFLLSMDVFQPNELYLPSKCCAIVNDLVITHIWNAQHWCACVCLPLRDMHQIVELTLSHPREGGRLCPPYKAELLLEGFFFCTQFFSLEIFINKKVGNQKN